MADLATILASGTIPLIKQSGHRVVDVDSFVEALAEAHADGVKIPDVGHADVDFSSIYWDSTAGRLRYRSPAGTRLQFRMQLV